jgi:hypothetical protein
VEQFRALTATLFDVHEHVRPLRDARARSPIALEIGTGGLSKH